MIYDDLGVKPVAIYAVRNGVRAEIERYVHEWCSRCWTSIAHECDAPTREPRPVGIVE